MNREAGAQSRSATSYKGKAVRPDGLTFAHPHLASTFLDDAHDPRRRDGQLDFRRRLVDRLRIPLVSRTIDQPVNERDRPSSSCCP